MKLLVGFIGKAGRKPARIPHRLVQVRFPAGTYRVLSPYRHTMSETSISPGLYRTICTAGALGARTGATRGSVTAPLGTRGCGGAQGHSVGWVGQRALPAVVSVIPSHAQPSQEPALREAALPAGHLRD